MSKNKRNNTIFLIVVIIVFVISYFINHNDVDFYKMNMYQLISLTLVVCVSYYLTQKRLDSRRKKDVLNELVKGIMVSSLGLNRDTIQSDNSKLFIMEIRNMQNKISLIDKVSKEFAIEKEVEYIKREIETIDDLVSNHLSDKDILLKLFVDIEKHISNIKNKCEEIQFNIYFS